MSLPRRVNLFVKAFKKRITQIKCLLKLVSLSSLPSLLKKMKKSNLSKTILLPVHR